MEVNGGLVDSEDIAAREEDAPGFTFMNDFDHLWETGTLRAAHHRLIRPSSGDEPAEGGRLAQLDG